ncbi:hypothetical protein ACHAO1_009199 [Botrytis cinerea]
MVVDPWQFTLAPAIRGVPGSSRKTSLLSECTAPSILPTSKSVDDAPFLWRFNLDMTMEKNDEEAISPTLADRKIEKTGGFFRLFKERFKDKW